MTDGSSTTVKCLTDIPGVRDYLNRIGAEAVNFRTAVIRTSGQYPRVIAKLRFDDVGEVLLVSGEAELPTDAEADAIQQGFQGVSFPKSIPFLWTGRHPPRNDERVPWSKVPGDKVHVCWDGPREHILFVQERVDPPKGKKFYRPWSYWDDGVWRPMEPDGPLPLFGLDRIDDHAVVVVHEGGKAAQAIQDLVDDPRARSQHPWGDDLAGYAHLGWLGGAERPNDTDWASLRRAGVQRVLLVCDNDQVGKNVVRPISRKVRLPMDAVFFDERFPQGFDLADPFPDELFKMVRGRMRYVGPSFVDCSKPATWATQPIRRPKDEDGRKQRGQTGFEIRPEFARDWLFVGSTGEFVHRQYPDRFHNPDKFNAEVRAISDVKNTADPMLLLPSIKVEAVCYRPDLQSGVINLDGQRKLNTHVGPRVKKRQGNIMPFYRFATQLLPDKGDRLNVLRWMATLIAVPSVRMGYGLLLCSPAQGVGKSTLTDHILAPLVGPWNVSHPDVQRAVTGGFNSWLANKRLACLAEMYVSHLGTKAYDALKPMMTDKTITVNEKFRPEYELENFVHFVGSSNSHVPMFMAGTDRRWLVPKVTNRKLPRGYWRGFYSWLTNEGLEIIHQWAFDFVAKHGSVAPEDEAPQSSAKRELVEASLSDGRRLLRDLAEHLKELADGDMPKRVILPIQAVKEWFGRQEHLTAAELKISERAIGEVFADCGLQVRSGDHRIRFGGRKLAAVVNFTPDEGEAWTELLDTCRWTAAQIREAFDAL